jgi:hypothetical protein
MAVIAREAYLRRTSLSDVRCYHQMSNPLSGRHARHLILGKSQNQNHFLFSLVTHSRGLASSPVAPTTASVEGVSPDVLLLPHALLQPCVLRRAPTSLRAQALPPLLTSPLLLVATLALSLTVVERERRRWLAVVKWGKEEGGEGFYKGMLRFRWRREEGKRREQYCMRAARTQMQSYVPSFQFSNV